MNMYIFDYWTSFPIREYAGLIVVKANSREEIISALEKGYNPFSLESLKDVNSCIKDAKEFVLAGEHESGLVDYFMA